MPLALSARGWTEHGEHREGGRGPREPRVGPRECILKRHNCHSDQASRCGLVCGVQEIGAGRHRASALGALVRLGCDLCVHARTDLELHLRGLVLTDYSPTYNYSGNGYADYDWSGSDYSAPTTRHHYSATTGAASLRRLQLRLRQLGFPVVLDLAGNGLNITPQSSSNVSTTWPATATSTAPPGPAPATASSCSISPARGRSPSANQVIFTDWDPTATSDMQALANVFDTKRAPGHDAGRPLRQTLASNGRAGP